MFSSQDVNTPSLCVVKQNNLYKKSLVYTLKKDSNILFLTYFSLVFLSNTNIL